MTFRISLLHERLRRLPMLRALLPFCIGLLCAEYWEWPAAWLIGALALCWLLAALFRSNLYAGAALLLFGLTAGAPRPPAGTLPRDRTVLLLLRTERYPAVRGRYASADAVVGAWRPADGGRWRPGGERIVLRADTALRIQAGEAYVCRGRLRDFSARNPAYRRLMHRRGKAGVVYLSQWGVLSRSEAFDTAPGLLHRAASKRLRRLPLRPESRALALAVAVGDRSEVTAGLRECYARSGTAHLLAVSGLHVGVVFLFANLLLWWLPLLRRGHLLRNLLAVALVWSYAAVAGFPPSAVRAAVMCSAMQFAFATGSAAVGLNTLAATAFVMLAIDPAYLFDPSFQLSFVAVASIFLWSLPLYRRLRLSGRSRTAGRRWGVRLANGVLGLLLTGVAASLATAPLVAHLFGSVSVVGALVTPLLLPATYVVILFSLAWTLIPLAGAAPLFAVPVDAAAALQNRIVERAALLPGGTLDGVLPANAAVACYLIFIALTLAAWCIEPKKSVSLYR